MYTVHEQFFEQVLSYAAPIGEYLPVSLLWDVLSDQVQFLGI